MIDELYMRGSLGFNAGKPAGMKFCKDCGYYTPALGSVGVPAACMSQKGKFNLVTGEPILFAGDAHSMRANEDKCGESAKWFVQATYDKEMK